MNSACYIDNGHVVVFWHDNFSSIKSNESTRRQQIMKKTIGTMMVTVAVVLLTATFSFAEYTAAGAGNFPYFQLGCLIVGGLILVSLKRKYERMYTAEVVGAFALYTILMALFTNPVIEAVKNIVS
jgi:FtsH-binding integral membrane protein